MKIFDITLPLCAQTPVWEGDKKVSIGHTSRIADGEDYNVSWFEMGAHTGTHLDAPSHVLAEGAGADQFALERLIGEAQVLLIPDEIRRITSTVLAQYGMAKGIQRVLFKTRNSQLLNETPYPWSADYTGLDSGAAEWLTRQGIWLAGIDGLTISPREDLFEPHRILLEAGTAILESLDLREVPPGVYDMYCLPLKLIGTDGAPARVILTSGE